MQDFEKRCMPAMLLVVQNLDKMVICSNNGPRLEISYIALLSVMTLRYHRLYKISSLEASLSLEDMKQLCRSHLYRYTYSKTNNN